MCCICEPLSYHTVVHFPRCFLRNLLSKIKKNVKTLYSHSVLTSFRCSANWAGTQCERPAPKSSRSDNTSGGKKWRNLLSMITNIGVITLLEICMFVLLNITNICTPHAFIHLHVFVGKCMPLKHQIVTGELQFCSDLYLQSSEAHEFRY